MKKFRHMLYWATVMVIFVPVVIMATIHVLYDATEPVFNRFQVWAYQERYMRISR